MNERHDASVGAHGMMLPFHLVAIGLSITRRWSTDKGRDLWYGRGRKYWQGTSSSNEGMLCGSAHVHGADIVDSENFLTKPVNDTTPPLWPLLRVAPPIRALDVGAGIGRVSRDLLLKLCDEVDMVDGCEKFVREAEKSLAGSNCPARRGRMCRFTCTDLQSFVVPDGRMRPYHLIWIQWCVGHLTDEDLVRLFRECSGALAPGGLLVVKDNTFELSKVDAEIRSEVVDGRYLVSEEDSSVIRALDHLLSLVQAGCRGSCKLVARADARLHDPELYPVVTLAMRASAVGHRAP